MQQVTSHATTEQAAAAPWRAEMERLQQQLSQLRMVVDSGQAWSPQAGPLQTTLSGSSAPTPTPGTAPGASAPVNEQTTLSGSSAPTPTPGTAPGASAPVNEQLTELFQELEGLELALVQERNKVHELIEERASRHEAHERDIAELEGMLQIMQQENQRLTVENQRLASEMGAFKPSSKKDSPLVGLVEPLVGAQVIPEPEMERSGII
eukprot:CAMPEP_0172785838 /NCGR_PEP_ID=MMETSP1074-20121228/205645_1 /TAXON_ID=2916 /ORGANISM="Ceratium fusus, Strain PA161109" /LENGTH=207 /DNA_ID=CAMNT_0013622851 /DNA_START=187 /DNA_END=810 /DNA_ORIENTATION=+